MKLSVLTAAWSFTLLAGAADLSNAFVELTFGPKGEIASLKDRASGRELVKKPMPFAEVTLKDGAKVEPVGFEVKEKKVGGESRWTAVWLFPNSGELELKVTPFDGGWTFASERFTVKDAETLDYMRVTPACDTYKGNYANMISDDADGVCIRAYDLKLEMPSPGGKWATYFPMRASRAFGFTGHRCGLAAGPKGAMQKMLQGMTLAAGVPYSTCGGAWCLGSDECRNSYFFSHYDGNNLDEWLNLLKLTGVGTLHLHHWYSSSANYTNVNLKKYPKGIASMKEVADAVHAAGYRVSLHTLSALIAGPNPWTGPVARDGLQSVYRYTTLNALTNGVTELLVAERPADDMDTVQTYSSFGNFLRLGGEIVQYTGIRREKPYGFTGITRGALGSRPADHAAGETAHYLRARYYGIYPDADSDVMDEIAERFAAVFNGIGADRVYFDGAEGIGPKYGRDGDYQIATMVNKMYGALRRAEGSVQMEMSCQNKHTWWLRANAGALDTAKYGMKLFDRDRFAYQKNSRAANLLEPQLGWWKPGETTDETDYYGAHVAGIGGAMSISGLGKEANKGPLGMHLQTELTVLGWYEHFRMAGAYSDAAMEKFRDLDSECRLRQDAAGEWRVEAIDCLAHRVTGPAARAWRVSRTAASACEPEIVILGGTAPYDDPSALLVADGTAADRLKVSTSAKTVAAAVGTTHDAQRGECFKITAVNGSGAQSNAWLSAKLDWSQDRKAFAPSEGLGFWVKGDGSGALLDVRLRQSNLYGSAPCDCLVRVDFTGWRYFEYLYDERDAYEIVRHVWPFALDWSIYSTVFNPKELDQLEIALTEIPVKREKEVFLDSNADAAMAAREGAEILVSPIRAVARRNPQLSAASLTVNGRRVALPFETLETGDRVKLEAGTWVLRGADGELKQKVKTGDALALKAGVNALSFAAAASSGEARADVRLILPGASVAALKPTDEWPLKDRWHGLFEAMAPVEYAPSKGATDLPDLRIRPGERARLEVQVVGAVKDPILEYETADGWQKVPVGSVADGKRVKRLTDHVLAGVRHLRFSCADPDAAVCRVEVIKHYTDDPLTETLEKPIRPIDYDPAVEMARSVDYGLVKALAARAKTVDSVGRNDVVVFGDGLSDACRASNHWALVTGALNLKRKGSFRFYNYALKGDTLKGVLARMDGKGAHVEIFTDLWDRPYDWAFFHFCGGQLRVEDCRDAARRLRARGVRRVVFIVPEVFAAPLRQACPEAEALGLPGAATSPADLAGAILDYLAATPKEKPVVISSKTMTIGIPENATEAQRYAADELARWTARMQGEVWPKTVVGEGTVTLRDSGDDSFAGQESFHLQEKDGKLIITGGKRGLLYGVYELLERYGGVAWFSSWRSHVPKNGRIAVPKGLDQRQTPAYLIRRTSWYDTCDRGGQADFAARCRNNGYRFGLQEKHGGEMRLFGAGLNQHGMYQLFPDSVYTTNAYPQCWAQIPPKDYRHGSHRQLCYSNPLVYEVSISNLIRKVRMDPGAPFYDCSQRDGWNYCRCPTCQAIIDEEKSLTGPFLRFVNKLAAAIDREIPGTRISMFNYHWTCAPCAKTKMAKNVVSYYCTFEADCFRPFEAVPCADNERLCREIAEWGRQSSEMLVWTYVTDFYNYCYTYPILPTLRPNMRFLRRNGARWMTASQGDSKGAHGHMAEYENWLISKWMWDPAQPEGELVDRFLKGYYGAAAPHVGEYLKKLSELKREPTHKLWTWEAADFGNVPESFLLEATMIWDKAEAAVKGDPELEYNVRFGKFCVLFTRFMMLRGKHAPYALKMDKYHDAEAHELALWLWDALATARFHVAFAEGNDRHQQIFDLIKEKAGK